MVPSKAGRALGLYCLIALLAGLYLFPFMRVLSGAPDEGIYLYASQRVAEGAVPGRDFVQENAPGAYYWLAWFFRLFGTNMITARALLLVTGVVTALLIFYLARRAGVSGLPAAVFVLITSIPLMPINSPHYDSNLFALIAFGVFLAGVDPMLHGRVKHWPFVIAGLLTSWVSCILQQKGFLFLAAFVVSLFILYRKRSLRPIALMIVSYAAVLVAELVPYAIWGALGDLFLTAVKMPLSNYQGLNQVTYGFPLWTIWFPTLFSQLRANTSLFIAASMLAAVSIPFLLMLLLPLVAALLGYMWRPRAFGKDLLPYWITGYAMWLSELHRQDLSHLRNGCLLLAVLFFVLCERYGSRLFKRTVLAVTLATMLLGTTTLNGALHARAPIVTRRGTLFAPQEDPVMEFLLSHTRPGDSVFIYPYSPVYYFLADVRNPTRINVIVDQRNSSLIQEAVRDLETKKPRYAIVETQLLGDGMRIMFPAFRPPAPPDRVIDRYIDAHYHEIALENGFRIVERNSQ